MATVEERRAYRREYYIRNRERYKLYQKERYFKNGGYLTFTKNCVMCGKEFTSKTEKRKTCSQLCLGRQYNMLHPGYNRESCLRNYYARTAEKRKKYNLKRDCVICGKSFISKISQTACSASCITKKYRLANPEKMRAKYRNWRLANPERVRENKKRYLQKLSNEQWDLKRAKKRAAYHRNYENYRNQKNKWRTENKWYEKIAFAKQILAETGVKLDKGLIAFAKQVLAETGVKL